MAAKVRKMDRGLEDRSQAEGKEAVVTGLPTEAGMQMFALLCGTQLMQIVSLMFSSWVYACSAR